MSMQVFHITRESNCLPKETQTICGENWLKFNHLTALFISLIFIVAIHHFIGWEKIAATWLQLGTNHFILSLGMIFCTYLIRSLRLYWHCYEALKNKGLLAVKVHIQHNFYNNLLPMRAGEFSFPILMKRHFGFSYAKSTGVLIWFRMLDFQALALLSLFILYTFELFNKWLLLALFILIFISPLILIWHPFQRLLNSIKPSGTLNPLKNRFITLFLKLKTGFPQNNTSFWVSWFLTLLNWVIKIFMFAWIIQFFYPMELNTAVIGAIGGEATSLLPIHGFAGIGSYEAGIAGSLIVFGKSQQEVFIAAINLHLILILSTLISMLLSMLIPNPTAKSN